MLISELSGQNGSYGLSDGYSIGCGNASGGRWSDLSSISINPALNEIPQKSNFLTLFIPNVTWEAYSNCLSFEDINYYFGGDSARYLTEDDKKRFRDAFNDDGVTGFDVAFSIFGLSWKPSKKTGTFTFRIADAASGMLVVPKSFIELVLNGNEKGRTYSFYNLKLESWWLRSYSLGYSRTEIDSGSGFFKHLTSGLSVKYLTGFAYIGTQYISSSIHTSNENEITLKLKTRSLTSFSKDLGVNYNFDVVNKTEQNITYFEKPSGSGYAFDLGFAAETNFGLILGLAIVDYGYILWSHNSAEHITEGNIRVDDLFSESQQDSVKNLIKTNGQYVSEFKTPAPVNLRFGMGFDWHRVAEFIPGSFWSVFDYCQGFNDMPSNSTKPRFSFGLSWIPGSYLPFISTGISNDIINKVRWSAGIGFKSPIFDLNLSTADILSYLSKSTKPNVSVAFSVSWKLIGG